MITKETIWKVFRFLSSFDNDDDYVYSPDELREDGYASYDAMMTTYEFRVSCEKDNELRHYMGKALDAIMHGDIVAEVEWFRERGIELGEQ